MRLAYIMVNRDREHLVTLAAPELGVLEDAIIGLQRSRDVLQEYWMTVAAALARLSIVIGRDVLNVPDD